LVHGATDVPLNAFGVRQAERVAARIQMLEELHSLHSSPLQRALQTATAIARTTRLDPRLHPGLAEMNFGEAEGLTYHQMLEHYNELMLRFTDPAEVDAAFPNGESRRQFHTRVRETVDYIVQEHTGERLVVVAHGGVIGSIVAQILGEDPYDWRKLEVHNCSVTHIELATDGPVAHLLNDVVHLDELDEVAAIASNGA
jgi:broad specificity phosphatase PhoE